MIFLNAFITGAGWGTGIIVVFEIAQRFLGWHIHIS